MAMANFNDDDDEAKHVAQRGSLDSGSGNVPGYPHLEKKKKRGPEFRLRQRAV